MKQGQRVGVIVFGSLVKITIPGTNYKVVTSISAKVKGGKTILAERLSDNSSIMYDPLLIEEGD